ncbi:hypothetical protein HMPREF3187_01776 [Aerococcus christensenii]|uniref:Uncharacterized protein n=1 Tax=Aerococcus christensenii TaxID=87541 RepID=A0A133XQC0_9LACT|nr:hypothetical protein HMPREF3187_01776 [Aerococcus christensenii]
MKSCQQHEAYLANQVIDQILEDPDNLNVTHVLDDEHCRL